MKRVAALAACLLLSSCTGVMAAPHPQAFFAFVSSLCGKAYAGRIVSPLAEGDSAFAGKPLVMHVRQCGSDEIRIPFHVGDDRSRTWVLTKIAGGLRLKHDHRHRDGSEDKLTQYGGDTIGDGQLRRQEFPADTFSKDLFRREGNPASVDNVWAMEVQLDRFFAYELRRPGRYFRVEFDLTRPIAAPPPPWGADRGGS